MALAKTTMSKRAPARGEYWRARIAEQERSGMTVQRFCECQGLTEQTFYVWRKRLRKQQPMRFALLETGLVRQQARTELGLELLLTTG
jgi:transposase-like protein